MLLRNRRRLCLVVAEAFEPERVHARGDGLLVQDADDHVLAEGRGQDRNAEVDGLAAGPELEPSVLGHAPLGDVQVAHDLDARDDGAVELDVDGLRGRVEHAVDAVLEQDVLVRGLDMDVAGPALQGVEDGGMHQLDDRAFVLVDAFQRQDLFAVLLLLDDLELEVLGHRVHHLLGAAAPLEHGLDRRTGC